MLDNLLSGAIGSALGVVGAFLAADYAFRKTKRHERQLAEHEHAIRTSGELAHSLVEFYEQLKLATGVELSDAEAIDVSHLRIAERALGRHITVDAPLLPGPLENVMRHLRDSMRPLFTPPMQTVSVGQLRQLQDAVREAGEELRSFRRDRVIRRKRLQSPDSTHSPREAA